MYTREDICERDTNRLCWKKAKKLLNHKFLENLERYNPIGPKDEDFLPYQKLKFLEKNLEQYSQDNID